MLPKWPKGSDCKSDCFAFGGSNPSHATEKMLVRLLFSHADHAEPHKLRRSPTKLLKCSGSRSSVPIPLAEVLAACRSPIRLVRRGPPTARVEVI